jgi:hypothetical protein
MSPQLQGEYIVDLLAILSAATELPGGFFEVEVPVGQAGPGYLSRKLTTEQLVAYIQTQLQAPALTTTQALATAQTNLANGQPNGGAGVQHLLVGDWNASGDGDQVVAVHAADAVRFRTNGTLFKPGQAAQEVLVDVAAGTTQAARAVDAYTKVQSDERFLKATALDPDYVELTPDPATTTATWAVSGKLEAKAFLNLAGATTLAIAGAANGWGGTLRLWNTSNGPLALTLPAGSFAPKNYNATLAAGERRFLAFEKVAGELFFNSGLYYPL